MFIEANSKPHDIVVYTGGSVTRDQSEWGFSVKKLGKNTVQRCLQSHYLQDQSPGTSLNGDSVSRNWERTLYRGAFKVTTSRLTMEAGAITCCTVAGLLEYPRAHSCHYSHRLRETVASSSSSVFPAISIEVYHFGLDFCVCDR